MKPGPGASYSDGHRVQITYAGATSVKDLSAGCCNEIVFNRWVAKGGNDDHCSSIQT